MTLRGRAHETRYLLVRNPDRLFKIVGKSTETTAEHNRYARFDRRARSIIRAACSARS